MNLSFVFSVFFYQAAIDSSKYFHSACLLQAKQILFFQPLHITFSNLQTCSSLDHSSVFLVPEDQNLQYYAVLQVLYRGEETII